MISESKKTGNFRRNRIDWDEEIRKTENIKRKGILMSSVSFAAACAFIFGISKFTGEEIKFPRQVLSVILLCAAIILFMAVMKRRRNKKNQNK